MWIARFVILLLQLLNIYGAPGDSDELYHQLKNTPMVLNGVHMTLSSLFDGDIPADRIQPLSHLIYAPPIISRKPAELAGEYINNVYIDRELVLQSGSGPSGALNKATASEIAAQIARQSSKIGPSSSRQETPALSAKLTVIKGPPGAGKTATTNKIFHEFSTNYPNNWIIQLNMAHLGKLLSGTITKWIFISQAVPEQYQSLFHELLNKKPEKIVIFIDDLERFITAHDDELFSVLNDLQNDGIKIVISCGERVLNNVQHMKPIVWEIPEPDFRETVGFFRNIWAPLIAYRWGEVTDPAIKNRMDTWMLGFTSLLFETPVPRYPTSLRAIGGIVTPVESITPFVIGIASISTLKSTLNRTPKKNIYDVIYRLVEDRYRDPVTRLQYGSLALENIIRKVEKADIASGLLQNIRHHMHADIFNQPNMKFRFVYPAVRKSISISPILINTHPLLPRADQHYRQTLRMLQNKYEFIYPDMENYFAAEFLAHILTKTDDCHYFLEYIYSEEKYARVLEFLTPSQIMSITQPDTQRLKSIVTASRNSWTRILDNFLVHGLETLFQGWIREIARLQKLNFLREYFHDDSKSIISLQRPLGMLKSSTTYQQLENADFPAEKRSRLDLIMEYHMMKIHHTMIILNLSPWALPNYGNHLHMTINDRQIPLTLIQLMIDYSQGNVALMDQFVYSMVAKTGDINIAITRLLLHRTSPYPATGRSLLQAALKWNNRDLLREIMDHYRLPITDATGVLDMELFAIALDSNPSPLYGIPGWWQKMCYLLTELNPRPFSMIEFYDRTTRQANFEIPIEDYRSRWFKVMLGAADLSRIPQLNVQNLKFSALNPIDRMIDQHYAETIVTPVSKWGLSDATLSLRRHLIMQKLCQSRDVTMLELMVNYQGNVPLKYDDAQYYRATISHLIRAESSILTDSAKQRILRTMIENIENWSDVRNLEYFMSEGLSTGAGLIQLMLDERTEMLTRASAPVGNPLELTVRERLTSTQLQSIKTFGVDSFIPVSYRDLQLQSPRPGTSSSVLECLRNRRRRRSVAITCAISLQDVKKFSTAVERHQLTLKPQIKSDEFLAVLAKTEKTDKQKAYQLVSLIKELKTSFPETFSLSGTSKMLMEDVVQHGSFYAYRKSLQTKNTMQSISSNVGLTSARYYPSKSTIIYGAMALTLIRSLHQTIAICFHSSANNSSNKDCAYASSLFALSAAVPIGMKIAMTYMPLIVQSFSKIALDMIPSVAPEFLRTNVLIAGQLSLKYGVSAMSHVVVIGSMLLDAYNIIQSAILLGKCSLQAPGCPPDVKVQLAISLTFSAVSIGASAAMIIMGTSLVAGSLIGVALMLGHMVALAINQAVYFSKHYSTTFGENLRISLRSMVFMGPPSDVGALARRTEWIKKLQDLAEEFLNDCSDDIVAYSVGIGRFESNSTRASYSTINMAYSSENNTRNRSRVLPEPRQNIIRLCLPNSDPNQEYYDYPKTIPTAAYACTNAFVIGRERIWEKQVFTPQSTIVYNLEFVDSGIVEGSHFLNNIFFIHNGTSDYIIRSSGPTINSYILMTSQFEGRILVNRASQKSILDMSNVPSTTLTFNWSPRYKVGTVTLKNHNFSVVAEDSAMPNLHVIGRKSIADSYNCKWSEQLESMIFNENNHHISVDCHGGESSTQMDFIQDCRISVINRFTVVAGSNSTSATYLASISLAGLFYNSARTVRARIETLNSHFILSFTQRPILMATISLMYDPPTKTLTWTFVYSSFEAMILDISPYYRFNSSTGRDVATCMFVDGFTNSTIAPMIDLSTHEVTSLSIQRFNVFSTVNSSRIVDVTRYYHHIKVFYGDTMNIITRFINPTTNDTFLFGSGLDDKFYIDDKMIYLMGFNGQDVYSLSEASPSQVWIDNFGADNAMDTLIVPDDLCEKLGAQVGSIDSDISDDSPDDVTLICQRGNSTRRLILMNYLMEPTYRHLLIYWRGVMHVVMADSELIDSEVLELATVVVFGSPTESATLMLQSSDHFLHIRGISLNNPLVAYKSEANVVLSTKYFSFNTLSLVVLEDFFVDDVNFVVSPKWKNLQVVIADEERGNEEISAILDAQGVQRLSMELVDDISDLVKEYHVRLDDFNSSNLISIEHNVDMRSRNSSQLGVAVIFGSHPGAFEGHIEDGDLVLMANGRKIVVQNWCTEPQQRLHSLEFVYDVKLEPITIDNIDQLNCGDENNSTITKTLKQRFKLAQKKLEMKKYYGDNDESRLKRCVGSVLADIFMKSSMHKLFDFKSPLDKINFVQKNCEKLFIHENLESLTKERMILALIHYRKISRMNHQLTRREKHVIKQFYSKFHRFNDKCWQKILHKLATKNDLMNILHLNDTMNDFRVCY